MKGPLKRKQQTTNNKETKENTEETHRLTMGGA
jgi:hypothetical protein